MVCRGAGGQDPVMLRRLGANRVSIIRVAGEQVSLAAAATKVLVFLVTGTAGLGHPAVTTVMVKPRASVPDIFQRGLRYIRKLNGQQTGAMAGQGGTVRSHREKQATPAVHAGFGALLIIIRRHEDHFHGVVPLDQLCPVTVYPGFCFRQLSPGWQDRKSTRLNSSHVRIS